MPAIGASSSASWSSDAGSGTPASSGRCSVRLARRRPGCGLGRPLELVRRRRPARRSAAARTRRGAASRGAATSGRRRRRRSRGRRGGGRRSPRRRRGPARGRRCRRASAPGRSRPTRRGRSTAGPPGAPGRSRPLAQQAPPVDLGRRTAGGRRRGRAWVLSRSPRPRRGSRRAVSPRTWRMSSSYLRTTPRVSSTTSGCSSRAPSDRSAAAQSSVSAMPGHLGQVRLAQAVDERRRPRGRGARAPRARARGRSRTPSARSGSRSSGTGSGA